MQTRNVPKKNYIIFTVMTVFVIATVLYIANWYSMTKEYFLDYSSMNTVLLNIDEHSFSDYISERSSVVVYISDSKDSGIKSFEKKFKKLVVNDDAKDGIIYLDVSKLESNTFLKNFGEHFFSDALKKKNNGLKVIPNLIYFEDGVATDILYTKDATINIDDVKSFLIECEVIEID